MGHKKDVTGFRQWSFIVFFLVICWFAMEAVHELGHVLAAWLTGATVERVVLWPISRTDTANVRFPLFVYGSGAVFGALFPLLLWGIARIIQSKRAYLFHFFAGFCLIANGAYIGGDFSTVGPTDTGLLIQYGANRIFLVVFGVFCVSLGLFLWNNQSRHFLKRHHQNGKNNRNLL